MADLFEDEEINALSWKMIQSVHWEKNWQSRWKRKEQIQSAFRNDKEIL